MKVTTTQPSPELLLIADAKLWLRISGTDEDTVIDDLIDSSRALIEGWCSCSIGTQTKVLTGYFCHDFELPFGPVQSITTVKREVNYIYEAETVNEGYRYLNDTLREFYAGDYQITYLAGYTSDTLPKGLRNAWLELIAYSYVNRGDSNGSIPQSIKMKLNPYKRTFGI